MNFIMNFEEIVLNGKFYFPAFTHYGGNPMLNVTCDRCHRNQLKACIGYKENDLCMDCVEIISSKMNFDMNQLIPYKFKPPKIFPEEYLTRMASDIYINPNKSLTRMESDIYITPKFPMTLMQQNLFKNRFELFHILDSIYSCDGTNCIHKIMYNYTTMKLEGSIIARDFWHKLSDEEKHHFEKFL